MNPIRSPKLAAGEGSQGWYNYYAGYPEPFVRELLTFLAGPSDAVVLDPWCGSGTTLSVAAECGYRSVGIDVSPILARVALARFASSAEREATRRRVERHFDGDRCAVVSDEDPLNDFFGPRTTADLRTLQRQLVPLPLSSFLKRGRICDTSEAFSTFVLFRLVRELTQQLRRSNPTWLISSEGRVELSRQQLKEVFEEQWSMLNRIQHLSGPDAVSTVYLGDNVDFSKEVGSVDLIVGSPPYLTRIDYVVATAPEFAALGYDVKSDSFGLRSKVTGTSIVRGWAPKLTGIQEVDTLLEDIRSHGSKASSTYYYKFFSKYFHSLISSLCSVGKTCNDSATLVLVLQGSYYKDIFVDLPELAAAICRALGWRLMDRFAFQNRRDIGRVNSRSRSYVKDRLANEETIIFRR